MMIRINAFAKADTENYAKAVAVARLLAEDSQKEVGCVAYDVFESATRGDIFMICETWDGAEALARHEASEHFKKFVGELTALAEVKIEKFDFAK